MSAYSIGASAYAPEQRAANLREAARRAQATVDKKARAAATETEYREAAKETVAAVGDEITAPTREDGLSAIIKWVPAEVIATYTAVVAVVAVGAVEQGQTNPSKVLFWGFTVFGGVWAVFAAIRAWQKLPKEDRKKTPFRWVDALLRGVVAALGFLLWSLVVPGSFSSTEWAWVEENPTIVTPIVILAAVLFGTVAESLFFAFQLRRAGSDPPTSRSRRFRVGRVDPLKGEKDEESKTLDLNEIDGGTVDVEPEQYGTSRVGYKEALAELERVALEARETAKEDVEGGMMSQDDFDRLFFSEQTIRDSIDEDAAGYLAALEGYADGMDPDLRALFKGAPV